METFSVLLALCKGNSPVTDEFPTQRPGTRCFDVYFDLRLNKRLGEPSSADDSRRHRAHYDVIVVNTLDIIKKVVFENYRDIVSVAKRNISRWCTSCVLLWRNLLSLVALECQNDNLRCYQFRMMTSSNGNIFRVTGHLCGEFTCPRWIPHTKPSDAELWCFLWSAPEYTAMKCHRAHHDVIWKTSSK